MDRAALLKYVRATRCAPGDRERFALDLIPLECATTSLRRVVDARGVAL